MKTLTIIRGVPGSGKSVLAKCMGDHLNASIIEADQFFVLTGEYKFDSNKLASAHHWCRDRVRVALKNGRSNVVVSNTSLKQEYVQPYLDMAEEFGYNVQDIIVMPSKFESVHGVPESSMNKMRKNLKSLLLDFAKKL